MRIAILVTLLASALSAPPRELAAAAKVQTVVERWPNGNVRRSMQMLGGVRHGEYRTWTIDGKPYELKHFAQGREAGLQQAWDERGELYLNYVVKGGRRYGMVNAKPCLPADADGTSSAAVGKSSATDALSSVADGGLVR